MSLASYGLGLIVGGLFVIFGGFLLIAINMFRRAIQNQSADKTFIRHITGMIVVTTGGFLTAIGLVLAGVDIYGRLIH